MGLRKVNEKAKGPANFRNEEASIFDKIKNAIKGAINKLLGVFKKESKTIDDANKDLKKLV